MSYTKELADKIRKRVASNVNLEIHRLETELTEDDLYLIQAYYLGLADGLKRKLQCC